MKKLSNRLNANISGEDTWRNQLSKPDFQIKEDGIDILFRGYSYANSIIDVLLPFKEIEPFVNKSGLLKWAYK